MIWEATEQDIQGCISLGERFHKAARLPGVFSPGVFGHFCQTLIQHDQGCLFRSAHGMIGGIIGPVPWDATYKVANEAFWWAEDGQGVALMKAYEAWAAENADETRMAFLWSVRPAAVGSVLGKNGYEFFETSMVKR